MWGGNGGGGNPWGPPQPTQPPPPSQAIHPQQHPGQHGQQWSFNPNHYANVPHNQVDWAALAQQWIMLKGGGGSNSSAEHGGSGNVPIPGMGGMVGHVGHPPPHIGPPGIPQMHQQPPIGFVVNHHVMPPHNGNNGNVLGSGGLNFNTHQHQAMMDSRIMTHGIPGGNKPGSCDILEEAPMDLEPLDTQDSIFKPEGVNPWNSAAHGPAAPAVSQHQTNWYAPESNNPWNTLQHKHTPPGTPPVVPPPPTINNPGYSTAPAPVKAASHPPGILHRQGILKDKKKPTGVYQNHHPNSSVFQEATMTGDSSSYPGSGGYWSTSDNSGDGAGFSNYYSAGHAQPQVAPTQVSGYSSDENSMTDFDSAKRKTLPLWIREGLEKMEREKQKKEEKAKQDAEREELRKRRLAEQQEQAAAEGKTVVESKWTAQTESREPSDEEGEPEPAIRAALSPVTKGPVTIKETLEDIMSRAPDHLHEELQRFALRYATTKLLLHVTNDEIRKAAVDMVQRVEAIKRKKVTSTSTTHIKKLGALASITGGALGLGEYASDSEQSENEAEKSDDDGDNSDSDSVDVDDLLAELNVTIERKQRAWELQLLEERKLRERSARSRSRSAGPGSSSVRDVEKVEELSRDKSHGREKREVEKTVVSPESEDKKKTNGRNTDLEPSAVPTSRVESETNKPVIIKDKEETKENSSKRRNRSRSKSRDRSRKEKDRKRRSKSRSSSRNRKSRKSRSSSRNRHSRRSHSKSRRSTSRRRSSSHSKSKRKRSRSSSRHRRRRSRSKSSPRNRNKKNSRSRSRSRDRHRKKGNHGSSKSKRRHKSRSHSRSRSNEKEVDSRSEVKHSSKETVKSKRDSVKKSDSRSRSASSDSSRKRTKSKKKHKKRSKSSSSDDDTSVSKSKKHKESTSSSAKVSKDKQ